jgi:DNA-binding NarL/FixJ family response regulator
MGSRTDLRQKPVVYVVEPHPVAASHLAMALKGNANLRVILSDVDLASQPVLSQRPSALIVDANELPLPLALYLRSVRKVFGDTKILAIGKRVSEDDVCRVLARGVSGYVTYDRVDSEIRNAVETVLTGGIWAAPPVLQRYVTVSSAPGGHNPSEHGGLSRREKEVAGLLVRKLCNKEIGWVLGIAERTVRFHLHSIFDKLGVHDRYSVIELARAGLVPGLGKETPRWKAA